MDIRNGNIRNGRIIQLKKGSHVWANMRIPDYFALENGETKDIQPFDCFEVLEDFSFLLSFDKNKNETLWYSLPIDPNGPKRVADELLLKGTQGPFRIKHAFFHRNWWPNEFTK